jgi:hypothetical protein
MMTRKERRAADHTARKIAQKAAKQNPTATPLATEKTATPADFEVLLAQALPDGPCDPENGVFCGEPNCIPCKTYSGEDDDEPVTPTPKPALSTARLEANRKSAQNSTGPTSAEGKAKVSQNAVKTALTGRTVLLPFDDVTAYQALLTGWVNEFKPVGPIETGLVQSLVDICWRLERIPGLEYALIEHGHNKLGHENPHVAATSPQATLELHIRQVHAKEFRNLHLQENRLTRRRERELKELRALQSARKAKEEEELKTAAQAALVAEHLSQPFELSALGFVFSTERFTQYMARLTPLTKQNLLKDALATPSETVKAAA